jgi:hypothetical protein
VSCKTPTSENLERKSVNTSLKIPRPSELAIMRPFRSMSMQRESALSSCVKRTPFITAAACDSQSKKIPNAANHPPSTSPRAQPWSKSQPVWT